jgi:hypothetical protein
MLTEMRHMFTRIQRAQTLTLTASAIVGLALLVAGFSSIVPLSVLLVGGVTVMWCSLRLRRLHTLMASAEFASPESVSELTWIANYFQAGLHMLEPAAHGRGPWVRFTGGSARTFKRSLFPWLTSRGFTAWMHVVATRHSGVLIEAMRNAAVSFRVEPREQVALNEAAIAVVELRTVWASDVTGEQNRAGLLQAQANEAWLFLNV